MFLIYRKFVLSYFERQNFVWNVHNWNADDDQPFANLNLTGQFVCHIRIVKFYFETSVHVRLYYNTCKLDKKTLDVGTHPSVSSAIIFPATFLFKTWQRWFPSSTFRSQTAQINACIIIYLKINPWVGWPRKLSRNRFLYFGWRSASCVQGNQCWTRSTISKSTHSDRVYVGPKEIAKNRGSLTN